MTALIYIVCLFAAAIVQTLLHFLLASSAVPIIPGSLVIFLVAVWAARKWSAAYKENKEIKEIRNASADVHRDDADWKE